MKLLSSISIKQRFKFNTYSEVFIKMKSEFTDDHRIYYRRESNDNQVYRSIDAQVLTEETRTIKEWV